MVAQMSLAPGMETRPTSDPAGNARLPSPTSISVDASDSRYGVGHGESLHDLRTADSLPPFTAVAVAPTVPSPTIYAGTGGYGIYQSRDRGVSWRTVYDGPGHVTSLAVYPNDPTTVLAGTSDIGVVQIAEDGGTYHYVSLGLPVLKVHSVAVDVSTATELYAGTGQGLYRSVDNGNTWTLFGLSTDEIDSIGLDRSHAEIVYAGTKLNGIQVTTDAGATWETLTSPGSPVRALLVEPWLHDVLYAATDGGGVARVVLPSITNPGELGAIGGLKYGPRTPGARFHLSKTQLPYSPFAGPFGGTVIDLQMDPLTPTTLYAASYVGIFKTIDAGETWHLTGLSARTVFSIAVDPVNPLNVYAGTDGEGFFKSTDGGISWSASEDPLMRGKVIYSVAVDPTNSQIIYAGGRGKDHNGTASGDWGGGVFKSIDGGTTWQAINSGLPEGWVYTIVVDPTNSSTVYAGTHSMGVFKSLDGGVTWEAKNVGLVAADHAFTDNLGIRSLAINPHDSQNLIVGVWGGSGVLETITGGDSWRMVGARGLSTRVRTVAFNPVSPALIYAGKISGGISFSGSQGTDPQWHPFPDQALGGWRDFSIVTAIEVNPTDGITMFIGVYGLGILRSGDGGLTWKVVNVGFSATSVTDLVTVPSRPATLYASTSGSGIFRSTNGGVSWSLHAWTGPWDHVRDIAVDPEDPNLLYAASSAGGLALLDLRAEEMHACGSPACGN
jgi:hypothetical protein